MWYSISIKVLRKKTQPVIEVSLTLPLKQCQCYCNCHLSWDSSLIRALDSWSKSCEFKSRQEQWENFLLQSQLCVLALIRCPFHPHVTAVARERPRSFCQKCRWQVTHEHAYTLDPWKSEWADYAAVQAKCENLSLYQEMRSHVTCLGTLGHSHLSSLSHCGLILA